MTLTAVDFRARSFRSLRSITVPLSNLEVFVGANGVGKTNLYSALELLRASAANDIGRALAEAGLQVSLWAGQRRAGPAQIVLGARFLDPHGAVRYDYEIAVGGPPPPKFNTTASFDREPQVKEETLTAMVRGRRTKLLERRHRRVMARDETDGWRRVDVDLMDSETVLGRLEDPSRFPELDLVRRTLMAWRFYHQVRTDAGSALRRPCVAVATPALASDGANLAAVLATIVYIGLDRTDLDAAVEAAFPGARLVIPNPGRMAEFAMVLPEFPHRPFAASELSDGTLRFLALAGALLAVRPPPFLALNEPEASLHPNLMEPLAGMIVKASKRSQVWLVTHSERLAQAVARLGDCTPRAVAKKDGATVIEGLKLWGEFDDGEDEDGDD
jgi:predicted ATPase